MLEEGKITARLEGITSRIFIKAEVETAEDTACVTIRDSHTNITEIYCKWKGSLWNGAEGQLPGTRKKKETVHPIQSLYIKRSL